MKSSHYLVIGILGVSGVGLGALGAHGLQQYTGGHDALVSEAQLSGFRTGVLYHLIHTLAIFATAVLYGRIKKKRLLLAIRSFLGGIILFSGSLYILAIRDLIGSPELSALGPVTPVGGIALIFGWLVLAFGMRTKRRIDE